MPPTPTEKRRAFIVMLDDDMDRALKVQALAERTTASGVVRRLLAEYLESTGALKPMVRITSVDGRIGRATRDVVPPRDRKRKGGRRPR